MNCFNVGMHQNNSDKPENQGQTKTKAKSGSAMNPLQIGNRIWTKLLQNCIKVRPRLAHLSRQIKCIAGN